VIQPLPPPRLDGRGADAELIRRRPHACTATRQHDDPGTNGEPLRPGLLSDKRRTFGKPEVWHFTEAKSRFVDLSVNDMNGPIPGRPQRSAAKGD
jgi:hypothetical protein